LGIVPGLQATTLVAANAKMAQKMLEPKKTMKPIKMSGNILKMGALNLIGVGLIKPTSKLINSL
jgi:hypothetical protein